MINDFDILLKQLRKTASSGNAVTQGLEQEGVAIGQSLLDSAQAAIFKLARGNSNPLDVQNQIASVLQTFGDEFAEQFSPKMWIAGNAGYDQQVSEVAVFFDGTDKFNLPKDFNVVDSQYITAINDSTNELQANVLEAFVWWYVVGQPGKYSRDELFNRINNSFIAASNRIKRIASTEIYKSFNLGYSTAFADVKPQIEVMGGSYWTMLDATLDMKTCPVCRKLHGKKIDLNAMIPPFHPHCRCTVITIISPKSASQKYVRERIS